MINQEDYCLVSECSKILSNAVLVEVALETSSALQIRTPPLAGRIIRL